MNIYDLAGNVWEWTLEKTSYANVTCVYRGGEYCYYCGYDNPVSFRDCTYENVAEYTIGFRSTLY